MNLCFYLNSRCFLIVDCLTSSLDCRNFVSFCKTCIHMQELHRKLMYSFSIYCQAKPPPVQWIYDSNAHEHLQIQTSVLNNKKKIKLPFEAYLDSILSDHIWICYKRHRLHPPTQTDGPDPRTIKSISPSKSLRIQPNRSTRRGSRSTRKPNPNRGDANGKQNPHTSRRRRRRWRRRRWRRWRRWWRTSRASPGAGRSWPTSTTFSGRPTASPCAPTPPPSSPSSPSSTRAPTPSASSTSCESRPLDAAVRENPNPVCSPNPIRRANLLFPHLAGGCFVRDAGRRSRLRLPTWGRRAAGTSWSPRPISSSPARRSRYAWRLISVRAVQWSNRIYLILSCIDYSLLVLEHYSWTKHSTFFFLRFVFCMCSSECV